jgi:hypothetical protein
MNKIIIISILFLFAILSVVQAGEATDTLNILYEIVGQKFHDDENIIKIKLPPFLTTGEVMEQIKLVAQWPGDPPPSQTTYIYVFKDSDKIGTTSNIGAVYVPKIGFKWSLNEWKPRKVKLTEPTLKEKFIYNTLLDSMFSKGLDYDNLRLKQNIANQFKMSTTRLDSIYFKVKYWIKYWPIGPN